MGKNKSALGFFAKYLTVWVLLCMAIGVLIGRYIPTISEFLNQLSYANVNLPIAVLIWLMIVPMMVKIDFTSIKNVGKDPKGLILTWVVNWLIKPVTMYGIASLFFLVLFKGILQGVPSDYMIGAILLGAAPCTAMVFVWSSLTKGNPAHTLVQVATNDLILLVAYVPIVGLLLGIGGVSVPWDTLFFSVGLFVVVPLVLGSIIRHSIIKQRGIEYLNNQFIPKWNPVTTIGLLLTLVLIFAMQADEIISQPLDIILIAIPLTIQTFLIFAIGYLSAKAMKLDLSIGAPASLIGASNFFELAVAVSIALFPLQSGVALATIVGVLVEVPVMLILVKIINSTRKWYEKSN